ncbi:hypothetical protein Nepgr_006809 [Nepenthes gracilis]|uniref:Uncharacterized protein n=1 Tax=Nepenthes gracilis TaxID=150966 RepID=A0AAD3S5R5_NEPGR|nr:hypothetical protein Nepgr_006809 [Nepenthes gracilis]
MEAARSPAFSPFSPLVGSATHFNGSLRPSSSAVLDSVMASVHTQSASIGESAHSDSLPGAAKVARMCVEVGRGNPLPPKIRLLTGATESALTVEVEIIYHSKPTRSSSGILNNQKRVTNRLPLARAFGVKRMCDATCLPMALAPRNEGGGSHSARVLDEVNLASPVGVKSPVSDSGLHDGLEEGSHGGLDVPQTSHVVGAEYVLADAVLGPKVGPAVDVGGSSGSLDSSDGAHHVLDSSSCSLDHSDGSLVGVPSFNVNDTSRGAHQPSLSTELASEQEPCNLVTINQFVGSPAGAFSHENCLIPGQLLMDPFVPVAAGQESSCYAALADNSRDNVVALTAIRLVSALGEKGFAANAQWLRGVFYCCAAVRQFVVDRAVEDCRRGGIVQGSSDKDATVAVRKLA